MSVYDLAHPVPGLSCQSLRINPARTRCFMPVMRTSGTEERVFPAQFEILLETRLKGKGFLLLFFIFILVTQIKQIVADGTPPVPCPASIMPWLAPKSPKSAFFCLRAGGKVWQSVTIWPLTFLSTSPFGEHGNSPGTDFGCMFKVPSASGC